jgi:hypothetical protein
MVGGGEGGGGLDGDVDVCGVGLFQLASESVCSLEVAGVKSLHVCCCLRNSRCIYIISSTYCGLYLHVNKVVNKQQVVNKRQTLSLSKESHIQSSSHL